MDAPEDTAEFTQEEMDKVRRYRDALIELTKANPVYGKNLSIYTSWPTGHRLWWIDQVEAQALAGKETIGAKIVLQVVMMRLEAEE